MQILTTQIEFSMFTLHSLKVVLSHNTAGEVTVTVDSGSNILLYLTIVKSWEVLIQQGFKFNRVMAQSPAHLNQLGVTYPFQCPLLLFLTILNIVFISPFSFLALSLPCFL